MQRGIRSEKHNTKARNRLSSWLDLQKSEIREKVLASSTPDDLKNIFEQYGEFSAMEG